jgi:hypothetical protein
MESVMLSNNPTQPQFPAVKIVVEAVADWIKRYREAIKCEKELARVDPEQIAAMAKDLGITTVQLRELASKGPESTKLLKRLLMALDTDPKRLEQIDPRVARDMLWLCFNCSEKSRCRHELSAGTAAQTFREFCPNAVALDEVFDLKSKANRH